MITDFIVRHSIRNWKDTKDPKVREDYGKTACITGIAVNVLLAAVKFTAGVITGAISVTADAVNNLSDAAGSVMSLVTVRMAAKPVDKEHPFGHGRMEYIGALVVGFIILLAGFSLLEGGIRGIVHPGETAFSWLVVGLLAFSILMKFWLFFFYRKLGKAIASEPLQAEAKDSLSDTVSTAAVLLGLLVQKFFGLHADGWIGTLVAVFVLRTGIGVCRDTINLLIGKEPDPAMVEALEKKLLSYPAIHGIHDLIVHDYGPGRTIATVHAEVDVHSDIVQVHEVIDDAERDIGREMGILITIHMDPTVTDDPETNAVKEKMSAFIKTVDPRLSLHDFRMVPGEMHKNLVFDCLLPDGYSDTKGLEKKLAEYAATLNPGYRVVVRFDTDFL